MAPLFLFHVFLLHGIHFHALKLYGAILKHKPSNKNSDTRLYISCKKYTPFFLYGFQMLPLWKKSYEHFNHNWSDSISNNQAHFSLHYFSNTSNYIIILNFNSPTIKLWFLSQVFQTQNSLCPNWIIAVKGVAVNQFEPTFCWHWNSSQNSINWCPHKFWCKEALALNHHLEVMSHTFCTSLSGTSTSAELDVMGITFI